MCGRYALWTATKDLQQLFELDLIADANEATWNAAPQQRLPAIFERYQTSHTPSGIDKGNSLVRRIQNLEWGLIPQWAKQPRALINARLETVAEKPSFAQSFRYRRCLIPANGYYEWKHLNGRRQAFFLSQAPGDPVMAFAGLYDAWRAGVEQAAEPGLVAGREGGYSGSEEASRSGAPWRRTFTIITRSAPDALGHIHERTPVIVPEYLWDRWLDPEGTDAAAVLRMVEAMETVPLFPRPVSAAVGSVGNDGPRLVEEVEVH